MPVKLQSIITGIFPPHTASNHLYYCNICNQTTGYHTPISLPVTSLYPWIYLSHFSKRECEKRLFLKKNLLPLLKQINCLWLDKKNKYHCAVKNTVTPGYINLKIHFNSIKQERNKKLFKMKKLMYPLTLLLIAAGCAKSPQLNDAANNKIDRQLIQEVKQITDNPSRLLAYSQLTSLEKYTIWNNHLQAWKTNGGLNSRQIETIQNVLNFINPSMWQTNKSKAAAGNSETAVLIMYSVKKNFDKGLAGLVFGNINDNYPGAAGQENNYRFYKDKFFTCQCNEGSWASQCSGNYTNCISVNTCKNNGTVECGFLGFFQCNGDCFAGGS
jgi:hypothetical protein